MRRNIFMHIYICTRMPRLKIYVFVKYAFFLDLKKSPLRQKQIYSLKALSENGMLKVMLDGTLFFSGNVARYYYYFFCIPCLPLKFANRYKT